MSNRARIQFFSRAVAGLVLVVLATACGSPTAPSANPTAPRQNQIAAPPNVPNLAGAYTLTLSASSRCGSELPDAMRTRSYPATIAQVRGSVVVTLPSIFPPFGNQTFGQDNRFTGVFGEANDVIFHFQFEEWFSAEPVTDFLAFGSMTATISDGELSGFWAGYMRGIVTNEDGRGNRVVTCTAPDHGVVFSR